MLGKHTAHDGGIRPISMHRHRHEILFHSRYVAMELNGDERIALPGIDGAEIGIESERPRRR